LAVTTTSNIALELASYEITAEWHLLQCAVYLEYFWFVTQSSAYK